MRLFQKVWTILSLPVLVLRALLSRRSIPDPGGRGTISCTTYGPREWAALLAIDSLSRGTARPVRVILFLDGPDYDLAALPLPFRALRRRGVEVRLVEHKDGAFNKLPAADWPDIGREPPVLTIDDDNFLEPDWLAGLLEAHDRHPEAVICYRARLMGLTPTGELTPYNSWPVLMEESDSIRLMPTGVCGALYPPKAFEAISRKGTGFRGLATNDDLWFRFCAIENGIPARLIRPADRPLRKIPFTQGTALWRYHQSGDTNDRLVAALLPLFDLQALRDGERQ
ncbi:MAG: glycosyltransferase family 2 protein [Gemmatimonadota bacterium]|jgi:hypothetical protein|nr:glycosyltransferase family 2 protein [Gemmatimonadota bacterium]